MKTLLPREVLSSLTQDWGRSAKLVGCSAEHLLAEVRIWWRVTVADLELCLQNPASSRWKQGGGFAARDSQCKGVGVREL